jgi:hypothetical protein
LWLTLRAPAVAAARYHNGTGGRHNGLYTDSRADISLCGSSDVNAAIKARLEVLGDVTIAGERTHTELLRRFYAAHNHATVWDTRRAQAGLVLLFPAARAALLAIPMPLLIGLNLIRVGGVLFVTLAAAGRLAGLFPHVAGLGDFVTGGLATPVAWMAMAKSGHHDRLIVTWNAFGALDLVVAVTLGIMSRNGSPLQLIHAGAGNAAMTTLLSCAREFSENNRTVNFDERLQSGALSPPAWPTDQPAREQGGTSSAA